MFVSGGVGTWNQSGIGIGSTLHERQSSYSGKSTIVNLHVKIKYISYKKFLFFHTPYFQKTFE